MEELLGHVGIAEGIDSKMANAYLAIQAIFGHFNLEKFALRGTFEPVPMANVGLGDPSATYPPFCPICGKVHICQNVSLQQVAFVDGATS